MELILFIGIVALVTHWLRKSLGTATRLPEWDRVLANLWIGSLVFWGLTLVPGLHFLGDWYGKIIFLLYLFTVYLLRDYRPARLLLLALLPYGVVFTLKAFFGTLTPGIYKANFNLFSTAEGFTTFWLVGFGIYALIQNNKERKLRIKQEEELRRAEARKAELEQMVQDRTMELTLQKEKLEQTLEELKATQARLIQSEKLASLGELTAGIAHEIQNPLNFVNNFSEVSVELAHELTEAIHQPEKDWALIEDLTKDLTQNQEKINHHGKRAAAIVTSMLQHARTGTGAKELTDLNALADEYLRLAYHGLRAKDSSFICRLETHFDPNLPKIDVVPQDIGRVFLNIINNAFYAVSQRARVGSPLVGDHEGHPYEPMVTVSTQKTGKQVIIMIKDNGTGIPEAIRDKIFQPFFTTKPTGQGMGLGLSLAHDIVVKGHGGSLELETKDGEGAAFSIFLPAD